MIFSPFIKYDSELAAELKTLSPVVLMGRGHSGTRVLSWACTHLGLKLGTSGNLATGDADDQRFTQVIKHIATNNIGMSTGDNLKAVDLVMFQQAVYRYYQELGRPTGWWGWKFPECYLIAPYVKEIFPKAKYIHLVRDGRDIAFKRHLTDDPKRKLGKRLLGRLNVLGQPHHLQAAVSWASQVEQFDRFSAGLAAEQCFYLTFEQLCQQPFEVLKRLCEFLAIPMTPACEDYLSNKINTSKVAQYRENSEQQIKEVETRIGDTLRKHGYLST